MRNLVAAGISAAVASLVGKLSSAAGIEIPRPIPDLKHPEQQWRSMKTV
ncbi:hypothetical protein [Undibacterium sp.]|nr:hypothetical protein [Undibacterium sp.]